MSRHDFELIAETLKQSKHVYAGDALVYGYKDIQWRSTVWAIAEAFAGTNERFNRRRFLSAAGYHED